MDGASEFEGGDCEAERLAEEVVGHDGYVCI